jgi:hypothetical protein
VLEFTRYLRSFSHDPRLSSSLNAVMLIQGLMLWQCLIMNTAAVTAAAAIATT